ncbi:TetR/AcrR family transcriptional regulator [Alcaligenaceae bacterium A4P071]|nr:TetR/AcrR family transcriptional regulator [Alcaligenaceae bacterium C4P045]MDQ2186570.1 TetR/AcrR family transcriptional regulator [Alcaligenaceae bacterium A4P071]
MSRQPVIDRNAVLNAVEALVREQGVAGLTIGAVARAAGISKGGVQSAFGTKAQLVQAVFDRWTADYDTSVATLVGHAPGPIDAFAGHVETTRRMDNAEADRAAGLMTAMLSTPDIRTQVSAWYRALLDRVDPHTPEGRQARLAFLATEGAFLLRSFGILQMTEAEWASMFEDIGRLMSEGREPKVGDQKGGGQKVGEQNVGNQEVANQKVANPEMGKP